MHEKYDLIGTNYNTTRKADPYIFSRLLNLLNPSKNGMYLDIGCGTGNYTKEFDKKGYRFIGIDPSLEMLNKAKKGDNKVKWEIGKAETLNLPNNSIDGIVASLTLHHWSSLDKGFASLRKVLRSNGNLIIFTASPKQMQGYWLHHYFPKMLQDSMIQMPSFEEIKTNLNKNGLTIVNTEKYFIKPDLEDLFLYSGKHNPKLYFESKVRHGISSFSSLSNALEVEKGLKSLEKDIASGNINDIIKNYENTDGDYLFLVVKTID
ncbi:class I SAM-dependent methyltransferase [Aquimarina sp. 2201CG14-23]|uniref:class I SAM-dependent methyltransferase n=1 Tax=Aquimarina mycalae TaxID=3040073 RepID=UPI0024780AD7|nr:class I SAM-dependent methyltransferase [Aquimarina sp. 2201CG14-23]MDH7448009.1 class I SAM-dependent methyltransferase [Aquimarina sp. 2201CG14-23]